MNMPVVVRSNSQYSLKTTYCLLFLLFDTAARHRL